MEKTGQQWALENNQWVFLRRNHRRTIQTENWISLSFFPGGSFAMSGAPFVGAGITLEQSVSLEASCPTTESFAIAFLKPKDIRGWFTREGLTSSVGRTKAEAIQMSDSQ
jgi:hypothetical protein